LALPAAAFWRVVLNVGPKVEVGQGVAGFHVKDDPDRGITLTKPKTGNEVDVVSLRLDSALIAAELADQGVVTIPFTTTSLADGNVGLRLLFDLGTPKSGMAMEGSKVLLWRVPVDGECKVGGWGAKGSPLVLEWSSQSSAVVEVLPEKTTRDVVTNWCLELDLDPLWEPPGSMQNLYWNDVVVTFDGGAEQQLQRNRWGALSRSNNSGKPWCLSVTQIIREKDVVLTITPELFR